MNKALQICQCDPILKPVYSILSVESCYEDSQTVLRPASIRVIADHSYIYTYEVYIFALSI